MTSRQTDTPIRQDEGHGQTTGVHQDLTAPATHRTRPHPLATAEQRRRPLPRAFAYITGNLDGGPALPLCRLRYGGSASIWGFAIYLASNDSYQESILPNGLPGGNPEEALDCACGLYLNDPTAWAQPQQD